MSDKRVFMNICDWEDDYSKKLEYYKTVPTEDLIALAEEQIYCDEFEAVLDALHERMPIKALQLAKAILEGDIYEYLVPIENLPPKNYVAFSATYLRPAEVDDFFKRWSSIQKYAKWDGWTIAELLRFVRKNDSMYVIDYLKKNMDIIDFPAFNEAISCIRTEYKTIDQDLLQEITQKYYSFEEDERTYIYSYKRLMRLIKQAKMQVKTKQQV